MVAPEGTRGVTKMPQASLPSASEASDVAVGVTAVPPKAQLDHLALIGPALARKNEVDQTLLDEVLRNWAIKSNVAA